MDVISLYKKGIKNVVAIMGTAVTKEQATMLKRLSQNIILCFDGDDAGVNAAISSGTEMLSVGIKPKIVRLENNMDPDEFINKYGEDKFNELITNAKSMLDFKMEHQKSITNFSSNEEISKYIKDTLLLLKDESDAIVRELTINKLSEETGINKTVIKGYLKDNPKKENKAVVKKTMLNRYEKAERRLIFYMLRHQEVAKIYENNKCPFPSLEYRQLAREIIFYYKKHENLFIADFLTYLTDKEELLKAFNEINTMDISENYTYEEIMDYIGLLNNYAVNEEIKRLTISFKNETDESRKTEIAKEISELKVSE